MRTVLLLLNVCIRFIDYPRGIRAGRYYIFANDQIFFSYTHIVTFSINPFWSSQIRVRVCVYTLRLCLGVGTFRSDRERAAYILFAMAQKIQFPENETEIKI